MTGDQQFALETMKWLAILAAILSLPITIIGFIAFHRTTSGAAKTFSLLIRRGSIIRLAAIFAIIFCTFELCVLGTLKTDLAASLFSGIAGYVLGGSSRSTGDTENERPD